MIPKYKMSGLIRLSAKESIYFSISEYFTNQIIFPSFGKKTFFLIAPPTTHDLALCLGASLFECTHLGFLI